MESRDGEMSNHFKLWSDDYEPLSHFPQPKPFTPGTGRQYIMCNRPIDYGTVPLALLCPIFGRFEDDFQTAPESDLNPNIFQATRELVNEMACLYPQEADRQQHFHQWLRGAYNVFPRTNTGDYQSDGHCEHPTDAEDGSRFLLLVTEAMLEHGDITTGAQVRGLKYYRTFYQTFTPSDLQGRGCLPAILLTYQGMLHIGDRVPFADG